MKGGNLVQILAGTLNPKSTNQCYNQLHQMRSTNNFTIELLVICDDSSQDISIRQSAIICLKNALEEHCKGQKFIPQGDIETIKASLLEAIIRNVTNGKLTPTFREIIYQMAHSYYPKEWPNIVDECLKVIQASTDLGGLLGAIETLKAIFSVFGNSVMKEIELNNLCNKAIIPLLNIASKLFQNFNQNTSYILVSIFKLFSTTIMLWMPEMVMLNIHNFMIFVKKILDLGIDLSSDDNISLYKLKRICLRMLFRIYQRHANIKMTKHSQFAQKFHGTYTKPFLETLLLQIMTKDDEKNKIARHRAKQLTKLSLSCLGHINRQNQEAAIIMLQHREGIIRLCFQKFRANLSRNYANFTDFKQYMNENRFHFKEMVMSLINCEAIKEQQGNSVNSILSLLLQYLEKGDNEQKQLALYLFTQISTEIKYLVEKIDEKMVMLVLTYAKPLLGGENHMIIRSRACQLISSYSYLDLPDDHIVPLAEQIYGCMMTGNSEHQTFLKIYACNAFNSLMKYDKISQFVKPFIPNLLEIYTQMLKSDASILKNFEDLIDLLEDEIAPFANDLSLLLIQTFADYTQNQPQNNYGQNENSKEEEGEDDDEDQNQEQDTNIEQCARACISSIRQILKTQCTKINENVSNQLFDLIIWVFSDKEQNYIEEGFNVLNLLLYKLNNFADSKFYVFFKVIVYAILGLPQSYVDDLRKKGDNFSLKFADILENVSVEPDKDFLQNSIGCLRNFIAKSPGNLLRNEKDQLNNSYMEYLFKVVHKVHENKQSSQTDRLMVLTIFISLIEYESVNDKELSQITGCVQNWMKMEHEIVELEQIQNKASQFNLQVTKPKYTYSPVYLQILLLSVNFYKCALQQVNVVIIVQRIVAMEESFKCDAELSRIIVGFSNILENKLIGQEQVIRRMLDSLPEFVRRLCNIRQEGDSPENDFDMDDEAQEEMAFGEDENTHVIGLNQPGPSNKDMMLQGGDDDEDSEDDWEEQFNKYYTSPLDKVEELKYLQDVMSRMNHIYGAYMSQEKQEKLGLFLNNAPPKLSQS